MSKEHQQPHVELDKSDARLRAIAVSAQDAIIMMDPAGLISFWNPAAETILGYGAEEAIGQNLHELLAPERFRNAHRAAFAEFLRSGQDNAVSKTVEMAARRKDGREIAVSLSLSAVSLEGKWHAVGILRDIAERKRAEELIRLDEKRLESLLELNQMTDASEAHLTHFAMEAAVRLTGSSIGYIAFANEDESVLTMYAWSSEAMRECAIESKPIVYKVCETGLWGEAIRQRRAVITNDYAAPNPLKKGMPDGHVHVTRHMNVPVFDGDRIVIVAGVGNKPTDYGEDDIRQLTLLMSGMWMLLRRRRAEEERERALAMLESALAQSQAGILIADAPDVTIRWANEAALGIRGESSLPLTGIEVERHSIHWQTFRTDGHPYPSEELPLSRAVLKGEITRSEEVIIRHASGEDHWVSVNAAPVRNPDGTITAGIAVFSDITERKHAQQTLESAFLFLSQNESIARIGGFKTNPLTDFLLWTEGVYCLVEAPLDYKPSLTEGMEFYAPEYRPVIRDAVMRTLITNKPFLVEAEAITTTGKRLWVEVRGLARIDAGGEPAVVGTFQDITERKRTEDALRESERRYRELVTNANSVILRMDCEGHITFFNEFAQRLFGYTEDEVLGRNVVGTIVPETDRAGRDLRRMILDIARRPSLYAQNENENTCRDGSRLWLTWTNTPVLDTQGNVCEILCIGNDITARKQAEEQIRESEAAVQRKLKAIAEPEGDLGTLELADIVDRDQFRAVMEAFHRITGIASAIIDLNGEVLVGVGWQDICTQFHRRHPETLKNCIESDTILTQDVVPGTFKTYRCKNNLIDMSTPIVFHGRHLGNFFIGQYLYDDDSHDESLFLRQARQYGFDEKAYLAAYSRTPRLKHETAEAMMSFYFELTRIITSLSFKNIQFARNLTERKQAEQERERLQLQLNQAQKLESVGRLAGGVAHDFNNMLGVILGHTEMALEQISPAEPLHDALEEIRKAAQRSADLTRQLLAFARRQTVAPKVLDLNETVEGMLKLLRRLIGEDIDLLWKPGPNVWPIQMDPAQLDQILANLCVNARDAIAGVGTVTIETGKACFDPNDCHHHPGFIAGEYAFLAVSDTGSGMDAETVAHIFEPFFTTKEMGQGTGLGLATVYGAVRQNNGFIHVYSEPGHGATFKIYLPRHEARTTPETEQPTPQEAVRGSETILLVEDESAILRMTTLILEKLGYTVLAANTPGEALRLAREYSGHIDLLMTDVILPEMNGRDLADRLLADHPNIQRMFMSGYTDDIIAHHGVLEKGVHFIQKPFSTKELAAHIRRALE